MKVGDVVKATIVNIKDFGAFADFDGGSGLIYFTQIVPRVEHGAIEGVLSIGDTVDCAISEIKPDGKISLTMKIKRKEARKAKIEEVKQDIQNMSEEDTNIRSICRCPSLSKMGVRRLTAKERNLLQKLTKRYILMLSRTKFGVYLVQTCSSTRRFPTFGISKQTRSYTIRR